MKKIFFIILAILKFTSSLQAQTTDANYFIPAPFPKAPNTAAQEKYGSYDVNLFTGVPNISIPLYTIESGGLKVPVTLSYHASGIKVSEVASWVGLGWSLSAGGTISRHVMGKADDAVGGYLQGWLRLASTFIPSNESDLDEWERIVKGEHDGQPDIYSYDFPAHEGKFFFDGNNNYKTALIPFSPISITNTNFNPSHFTDPYIPKFNIIDEHGNNLLFGYNTTETTATATQSTVGVPYTSAWMLEKMISQNRRDTVSFNYTNQVVHSPDVSSQTYYINDNVNASAGQYINSRGIGLSNSNSSTIDEKLLSEIYFKNGKVVFETDPSVRQDLISSGIHALKSIKIFNYNYSIKDYELQKSIVFYTSYFDPLHNKRLKLDSIQILDKAGIKQQKYRFDYNEAINLPTYGSYAIDYWGYYNGKANDVLIPRMTVPYAQSNIIIGSTVPNSRESDSTFMQANVLNRIWYPTGGYTEFAFQTNQYLDGGTLKLAGGLRVKSIKSYDGVNSLPVVKTYIYENVSARKNFVIDFGFFVNSQTRQYWGSTSPGGLGVQVLATMTSRTYVSNSKVDLEPFDAATVVYPKVSEYTGTIDNNAGRTDYIFRDNSDLFSSATMTGTPVIKSYFFARGQLISKSEYLRKSNGSYQIVRMDSTSYKAFPTRYFVAVGLVAGRSRINEGLRTGIVYYPEAFGHDPVTQNGFLMSNYDMVAEDNYATGTLSRTFDSDVPAKVITSVSEMKYDNIKHQQVTRTRHVDSRGNTTVSKSKYPADYLIGQATTTTNTILDAMLTNNMQAEEIEKWDSVQTVSPVVNGVTGGQLNIFKAGQIAGTIVPSTISKLNVSTPVTNFDTSKVVSGSLTTDSRYVQMIDFNKYDSKNNIVQYSPRNATPTYIIWDYLQAMPIAQVKNMISTVPETAAAYTSFEAQGKGNWTYTGTASVSSTAPTGSRVYPLWSGAVSSPFPDVNRTYVVSYWSDGVAATVSFTGVNYPGTAVRKSNEWTCYEHLVPVSDILGKITLTGGVQIDELRLYPSDAQITTYTYNPDGLTHITDPKNQINRFEYDYFGRLKNIKDWNGNIVKNFGYHYYDSLSTP
jgi:YD repeat-containing protein